MRVAETVDERVITAHCDEPGDHLFLEIYQGLKGERLDTLEFNGNEAEDLYKMIGEQIHG